MKSSHILSLVLLITLSFGACKNKSGSFKPNAGGSAGELLVVMDDKWKETPGGEALKSIIVQPYLGLPQQEPMFDILITPHRGFTNHLKTYRNLIVTKISADVETDTIKYYKGVWAKDQALVRIWAKSSEKMAEMVRNHEIKLLSFFNKAERERYVKSFRKYIHGEFSEKIKAKWNVSLSVPTSFQRSKEVDDLIWMNEETTFGSQGIIVYSFDYVGEGTFSKEYLLNKRDSMLKANIPGPSEGSYMATEHKWPIIYKTPTVNDNKAIEMRGLWKVVGDMMGGPWLSHTHHDAKNRRVIVVEAYVYSPENPEKRNPIRQLEAVLYSYHSTEEKK
jgi:hypothetical protein